MNTIMFNSEAGEPCAILLLSESDGPRRAGVLVQPPFERSHGREAEALLNGGPIAHSCSYAVESDTTVVALEHQDGWRILVNLYSHDEGDWTATRGAQTMFGQAIGLRRYSA